MLTAAEQRIDALAAGVRVSATTSALDALREVVRLYDDEPITSSPRRAVWIEDFETAINKARAVVNAHGVSGSDRQPFALQPPTP